MKTLIIIIFAMTSLSTNAQNTKASTVKKTFNRTTTVSQVINASTNDVWSLLTDADDYPRWNSTVLSIEGKISEGQKIKLKSSLDPSRTFKLKVKEVIPNEKLVWGDAMGKRTYTLRSEGGKTIFTMTEKIGGLMFPLFASKIPSFDDSFDTFASDLAKEAESK